MTRITLLIFAFSIALPASAQQRTKEPQASPQYQLRIFTDPNYKNICADPDGKIPPFIMLERLATTPTRADIQIADVEAIKVLRISPDLLRKFLPTTASLQAVLTGTPTNGAVPLTLSLSIPGLAGFIEYEETQPPLPVSESIRISTQGIVPGNTPWTLASLQEYQGINYFIAEVGTAFKAPALILPTFYKITSEWKPDGSENPKVATLVLPASSTASICKEQSFPYYTTTPARTDAISVSSVLFSFEAMLSAPDKDGRMTIHINMQNAEMESFTKERPLLPHALTWQLSTSFSVDTAQLFRDTQPLRYIVDIDGAQANAQFPGQGADVNTTDTAKAKLPITFTRTKGSETITLSPDVKTDTKGRLTVSIETCKPSAF